MALLEARPYRPFKSSEEYLYAMKEDLAEWLNALYPGLDLGVDNFLDRLETGVLLCKVSTTYFATFKRVVTVTFINLEHGRVAIPPHLLLKGVNFVLLGTIVLGIIYVPPVCIFSGTFILLLLLILIVFIKFCTFPYLLFGKFDTPVQNILFYPRFQWRAWLSQSHTHSPVLTRLVVWSTRH